MQVDLLGPVEPLCSHIGEGPVKLGRDLLNIGTPVVDLILNNLTA